ncbi:MAG: hypothetical protein ANABAC_3214 [Anaerolineae bacterium]|jgi:hypothetical protein|nr:MAG: hypothetical protein ANABAC_3214 [Anaerolineae bacterium]
MNEINAWEYRIVSLGSWWRGPRDEDLEAALNELGAAGWEVVGFANEYSSGKVRLVAKRPLTDRTRRQRSMPR